VSDGDELAFMALVQRHGPMVLAGCCGVLNDNSDADDAFHGIPRSGPQGSIALDKGFSRWLAPSSVPPDRL
jgi:hypothetical protein